MRIAVDARVLQETAPTGVSRAALWHLEAVQLAYPELEIELHTRGLKPPHLPASLVDFKIVHHSAPNRLTNAFITAGYNQPKFFGECDIVWQPNPMFAPVPTVPTLVTVHDLSPYFWPEFFPFRTRYWYNAWVHRYLQTAHPLVTLAAVSERTKRDIELNYPQWKGRVFVLPPAMPTPIELYLPSNDGGIHFSKPYIVALSTIEPRKNMRAVVMAHKLLRKTIPDLSLVIIGASKSDLALSEEDKQYVVGYINDTDRNRIMTGALAVVYPSYYEGYGYPALESFALNVPVVVSATGALPESVGNAGLYVSPDRAVEDLCAVILSLNNDNAFRAQVVQAGRDRLQYLRSQYDPSHIVELWKKLLSA